MTVEGLSPLEAYRADLAAGTQGGKVFLGASMTLWEASKSRLGTRRLLSSAASQAADELGSEALKRGCSYDARPSRSSIGILRLAAHETELAGYLISASVILDSLAAVCSSASTAGIYVLADRARNARKRGRVDLAQARAEHAIKLARRARNSDLLSRCLMELSAVYQARGNYPEFAKYARKGLVLAEQVGNRRLISSAHSSIGVRAAMAGNLDAAIQHFVTAYRLARPPEPQFFAAVSNLAQVALDAGHPRFALRIARHGLSRPLPLQNAFALLGTAVVASAQEDNVESAIWAADEVERLSVGDRHPREAALALTECWEAHTRLRRLRSASRARRAAVGLATKYGFPEILHRLDQKIAETAREASAALRPTRVAALSAVGEDSNEPIRVAVAV